MQRRNFLKTVGIASAGFAATGVAQAGDRNYGIRDLGIEDEIKSLLRAGKVQKAHRILDEQGVNYTHTGFGSPSTGEGGDDPQVGTEYLSNPENSDNEFDLGVYDLADYEDRYYAFEYWELKDMISPDSPGPVDGASISYSDNALRYVTGTANHSDQVAEENTNPNGYRVDFNDVRTVLLAGAESGSTQDTDDQVSTQNHGDDGYHNEGWMDMEVELRDDYYDDKVTVYGDYVHTWNPWGLPSNFGISFSLTGAGVLSFSVTGYVDTWRAEDNVGHSV